MKSFMRKTAALSLALLMLFECAGFAYASTAGDMQPIPAENEEPAVPERFQDGGNWFFIPEPNYAISEKSADKLYIPVRRAGDLSAEAEVTLKLIDLSAHCGVNYSAEIDNEAVEPELIFSNLAIVDIMQSADEVVEFEPLEDENELGELIHEAGGAELVDGEGKTVATVTATPVDENGRPITEETETEAGEESPAEDALTPTQQLRAARNAYTGTLSDRQELKSSEPLYGLNDSSMSEDEYNKAMADAVADNYPGKEYRLSFASGEDTKYLVITPLYSPKGEGDAQIILMLKNPGEGFEIGEDVNPVSVIIHDEDEPEPVYVEMDSDTVIAENGIAKIKVNRSGRINAPKGVRISSWGGSAKQGEEYSGIGAELWFSMGLTTRSVEIPVGHGSEEKDFYVTITAMTDEEISLATTHVIIPPAELKNEGSLMGISDVEGHPFSAPIDLSPGSFDRGGLDGNTGFHLSTSIDKEETSHYWMDHVSKYGYAYDGLYVHFNGFLDWCDGEFRLVKWNGGSFTRMHMNSFTDGGKHDDHWLYGAWGDPKAPENITIEAANVNNDGWAWTDNYAAMWVDEVRLIKRQFEITVHNAEVKPLIGVSNEEVLREYEAVYLDGNTSRTQTHWTEDSFSITAKTKGPLRLVGVEAQVGNSWKRIATIDGKSSSVVVPLTTDIINSLQSMGAIRWSENGRPSYSAQDSTGYSGSFYKGSISVRPVFEYINADVEVQEDSNHYGSLSMSAPTPTLLWEFGTNSGMNNVMRDKSGGLSSYSAKSGEGTKNGYYTFNASGSDPYVFIDTPRGDAKDLIWVKIKARSTSAAPRLQLFSECKDQGWYGDSCENITLQNDGQWHEYVHRISNSKWQNRVNWLRLDPLDGSNPGDQIDIDYIAFFPDEAGAKAYQPENEAPVQLEPGVYTYHLGDRLDFSGNLSERGDVLGMVPDGVQYELRAQGNAGSVMNSNVLHFINDTIGLRLSGETSGGSVVDRPYYKVKPTFTHDRNNMVVEISDEDYAKLDPEKGILAEDGHKAILHDNGVYSVVVADGIRANEIYALRASVKNDDAIPSWRLRDGSEYSGTIFYTMSNPLPEENIITLKLPKNQKLSYMVLSGSVATSTFNMNTARSATDVIEAKNAWVSFDEYGAWTKEDGSFELPAIRCANSTNIRFLVDYNGFTSIKEAIIPGGSSKTYDAKTQEGASVKAVNAKAGTVMVENFSDSGAHFVSVLAEQDKKLLGAFDALSMDGNRLLVTVKAAPGQYVLNNQTYTENILDVTLFFMDQDTGRVDASFSSNNTPPKNSEVMWGWVPDESGGGTFTLDIPKFDPEHENDWTYNDVLMARLTTDKKSVTSFFTGEKEMHYDAVSTGFAVISDPNYEPQVFDMTIDDMAEFLGIEPISDEDGNLLGDDKRASFGTFPYIGEITTAVHAIHKIASTALQTKEAEKIIEDVEVMADGASGGETIGEGIMTDVADLAIDNADELVEALGGGGEGGDSSDGGGGTVHNIVFSILVKFTRTFYGGTRFMFGVVVGYGGGEGYVSRKNPLNNANTFLAALGDSKEGKKDEATVGSDGVVYIHNAPGTEGGRPGRGAYLQNLKNAEFGGPYFTICAYMGIYIDFGYIELKELDENGLPQKSHDAIFMGIGGFIGFGATVGYTAPISLGPIPAYINLEAGITLTVFLGTTADPNKTLAEYQKLEDFQNTKEVRAQDYSFNFDFLGRAYIAGTFGIGVFRVLGVRITAELVFEFGYSNKVVDWYPKLFDHGWGCVMEAGFTGTIDLLITSIPVYSASWPLPVGTGFMRYMQEMRRANRCISYVENGITAGRGTQADRNEAYRRCRELELIVDAMSYDRDTIEEKTYALKDWAYEHDILSWVAKNSIEMNSQGGLVGAVVNAVLESDDDPALPYYTRPHVHSKFVGNDGQLMAAYGPVQRTDVVVDAFEQPSSQIIAIGGGRYLMVYLDDSLNRDAMQAATLKWTVYDANDGSFTEPKTVQNDLTADSRPNLVDAGDRIILSWASATDEKFTSLKAEFAEQLEASAGYEPSDYDVSKAMEADPARVYSIFDIFTAEFDKGSESFGEITQLTDDSFYDDYPQAVYDSETGDIVVFYTKTSQDDDKYSSEGEKLLDIIGASPDPDRTYSVVMYMLYNNQTDAEDTRGNKHEPGWARDYYFPNETAESLEDQAVSLASWGGQRFLPSVIQSEDGEYLDPPINDLTVAPGYNGFASYAYTVDMDFDLDTAEDRALYFQTYDFKEHATYFPIRVAGSVTEEVESYDSESSSWVTREVTRQVEVGAPKLVRNGKGSIYDGANTFLFWREDGQTLKYLNVTELLNAKVPSEQNPGEDDWTWAISPNGELAVDAVTGKPYEIKTNRVDFGSLLTDAAIEITDYNVITDEEDNIYVVWTDSVSLDKESDAEDGAAFSGVAQEIYASAMIRQDARNVSGEAEDGSAASETIQTARWSKPYRITRDGAFNDGVALALDEEGGLIIVHNRYSKQTASSEEEVESLIQQGKIGMIQDKEGNYYAASLSYNSPLTLSITRCEKIGSLEATIFNFDDTRPVAGETIKITAVIENMGLIDAEGCEVEFYEYKDGVRRRKIGETVVYDDRIAVNTGKTVSFSWTVPADGPEGYSIQAVTREKKADGGYYDAVTTYSGSFTPVASYHLAIKDIKQDGDKFALSYSIENLGNAPAEEGTTAVIRLVGLYGDLNSERYGYVDNDVLYSEDVSSRLPAKTVSTDPESGRGTVLKSSFEDEQMITIPASVFRFSGYDAITLQLIDKDGRILEETSQKLVAMGQPMNLSLNGGNELSLKAGESVSVPFSYDTTAFIENNPAVYTVADPNVAEVKADGSLMAVSDGTTTLTATLLPSGRSVSVPVKVGKGSSGGSSSGGSSGGSETVVVVPGKTETGDTEPAEGSGAETGDSEAAETYTPPTAEEKEALLGSYSDIDLNEWYCDSIFWALSNEIMGGYGKGRFKPNDATSRAMIVTMLYRMEGEPEGDYEKSFTDLAADGEWYWDAVGWAAEKGIVEGTGGTKFRPEDKLTREQLAAILLRYAKYKGKVAEAESAGTAISTEQSDTTVISSERSESRNLKTAFTDSADISPWAFDAIEWAVGAGIITGFKNGSLKPQGDASRAQVATMLMRFSEIK